MKAALFVLVFAVSPVRAQAASQQPSDAALPVGRRVPQAASELSLTMRVQAALRYSPQLRAVRARSAQARASVREASLSRLPRLSAQGSWTRSDDALFAFGSLLQQRTVTQADFDPSRVNHPGYRTDILGSLEAGLPLFTGFELTHARKQGELAAEQADSSAQAFSQKLRYDVLDAHLRVLLARQSVEILRSRVDSAARELADADRLRLKGLVLGSDYYAAAGILEGLRAWKRRLEGELEAARGGLTVLSGEGGEPAKTESLKEAAYPVPSLEEIERSALERRSDLAAAALQEDSARLGLSRAKLSISPRMDAFAALQLHSRDFSAAPSDRMFGVRLQAPFGDASYWARQEGARQRLAQAGAERADAVDAARLQSVQARAGYAAVVESLPQMRDMVERVGRSLELFRPLYREGRQSVLEVLRAEEALARAQTALLESFYRVHSGWAGVRLAAGTLDDEAVAAVARNLETAQ